MRAVRFWDGDRWRVGVEASTGPKWVKVVALRPSRGVVLLSFLAYEYKASTLDHDLDVIISGYLAQPRITKAAQEALEANRPTSHCVSFDTGTVRV